MSVCGQPHALQHSPRPGLPAEARLSCACTAAAITRRGSELPELALAAVLAETHSCAPLADALTLIEDTAAEQNQPLWVSQP